MKWPQNRFLTPIFLIILMLLTGLLSGCTWVMPTSSASEVPIAFSYQVRIYAEDTGEPIEDAKVIIEVTSQAPLDVVSDSEGFARVLVSTHHADRPGLLIVEATGYKRYRKYIDLTQGTLPGVIRMAPLVANVVPAITPTIADTPGISATEMPAVTPSPPTPTVVDSPTATEAVEVASPTPTDTPTATGIPASTNAPPTPTATIVSTTPVVPINSSESATPFPEAGIFIDFENIISWRLGDQLYGELNRSSAQVHGGNFAGELVYNFPAVEENFVVFQRSLSLGGRPSMFSAWVYGDESGHFLNMWLRDTDGEIWQTTFGQIRHTGWQRLSAVLDQAQRWPNGLIANARNEEIDYPISFYALVLDGVPDRSASRGTVYIDDLKTETNLPPIPTPSESPPPVSPTPILDSPPLAGRLAFPVDDGSGHYDVWIMDLPSGQPFRAIQGARQPNISQKDGRLLVNGDNVEPSLNLLLYSSSLNFVNIASESPDDEYPFWDPEGTRFTYSRTNLRRLFTNCSVKRPTQDNGVACQRIEEFGVISTQFAGQLVADMPVWTRDGKHNLIFRWRAGPPNEGLALIGSWATARDKNPLEPFPSPVLLLRSGTARPTDTWGNTVYFFASDLESNWEVYALDLNGGNPVNLSNSAHSSDGLPTVSPDGRWVAFASDRDGRWGIWVVPAAGGTPQKLTDFPKANPWGRGDHDWTSERISWGS